MYAIVDIETTGGYAANNDITEVAIVLHNGISVVDRYETLIRPARADPLLYPGTDRHHTGNGGRCTDI